ncbi:N-acetyltransferase [Sulfurimonas sp.]|uniref:N-acetyltransferase n=1 Tax=Sulfurimonas sp. TaxID=2022749 RepID=UPI002AB0709E|nr:N-acetyltransferase [Sulfurimonas sp.]
MLNYQKAQLSDIANMQELVNPEIESGIILNRTNDEVATNIRSYTLCFYDGELIGFCAMHIHTEYLGEIRSLVVKQSARGKKIGEKLVERCLDEAKDLKLQKVLCLTYKQLFFENLGFVEISKDSIPEHKIWADCIKCKHFPVCNEVSLIKTL